MKTASLWKKLGHFRTEQDLKGNFYFSSRIQNGRVVMVVEQGKNCIALPIICDSKKVAFHATTIKSLVEFLEGK